MEKKILDLQNKNEYLKHTNKQLHIELEDYKKKNANLNEIIHYRADCKNHLKDFCKMSRTIKQDAHDFALAVVQNVHKENLDDILITEFGNHPNIIKLATLIKNFNDEIYKLSIQVNELNEKTNTDAVQLQYLVQTENLYKDLAIKYKECKNKLIDQEIRLTDLVASFTEKCKQKYNL